MNHACRKLAVLALVGAVALVFGVLGPAGQRDVAEADLAAPGGISALPSAAPAVPGVVNQGIPAIIRARSPGNAALVSVFCDPTGEAPDRMLRCAGDALTNPYRPIDFEMTRVYPAGSAPASKFSASQTAELTCMSDLGTASGGGPCDLSPSNGVVVVRVEGGGVNEIVRVTATDAVGESRSVDIVVVDTILAWGPSGILSTAAQHEPAFISYACPDIGETLLPYVEQTDPPAYIPLSLAAAGDPDQDGSAGLDDLWDLLYNESGLGFGTLANSLLGDVDIGLLWCGGDTDSPLDDFVDFQTDLGVFSTDPPGVEAGLEVAEGALWWGIDVPQTLDYDCGEGKNIDVMDVDALAIWGALLWPQAAAQQGTGIRTEGGCDADFARNGVVTTMILGNGEVGVATIKAQQGGAVSPPRTVNLTFVGEAALGLFIEMPENIGAGGGEFTVAVVDQNGRPAGDETLQCTVEPSGGALVVVPQTGTTDPLNGVDMDGDTLIGEDIVDEEDNDGDTVVDEDSGGHPGEAVMTLVPTGASVLAGDELTLTCVLDRDRSVSASVAIPLSTTPGMTSVELPTAGCIPLGSTWEDGTDIATVAGAVEPPEALDAIWVFDAGSGTWVGYSPDAPGASDLTSVDRLEVVFICMSEPGSVLQPTL